MSQLVDLIYDAGIVGAGGAGFPTHVKAKGHVKTLIINGAECEPLLQVDKTLMTAFTSELVEGIDYIMKSMQIEKSIIGIKNKYTEIIEQLHRFIDDKPDINVQPLPNVYPVGDEVVLIQETTGITLKKGVLPITEGLMVMNVETILNIYKKVFGGANVTHSYVTVIGEVENEGTYQFPIGTPLADVLKDTCKPKIKDYRVLVGGPMTGSLAKPDEVVRKNTKGFIILPKDHNLIRNMEDVDKTHLTRIMASCSQCRACTDMCPRHLLGHQVEPHKLMNAMANGMLDNVSVLKTALGCVNCGVCELYACHHDLSPRKMMVAVKAAYAKEGVRPGPEDSIDPHTDRDYRRVPAKRLVMHLNLTKYDRHVHTYLDVYPAAKVVIPLNQHIGAPSKPLVKVGDKVDLNQRIGENPEGALGAHIHASLTGIVTQVNDRAISIERKA